MSTAGDINFTRSCATPKESGWILRGTKSVVFGAHKASHFLIPAILNSQSSSAQHETELGLFIVHADHEDIDLKIFTLYEGSKAADIVINNVFVGADQLIARGEQAISLIEEALDRGRVALCQEALGLMEKLHDITLEYVKAREQFGQKIGTFQTMQHRMADIYMQIELARSATQLATDAVQGSNSSERMRMVSAAMYSLCKSARHVGQSAVQAHGGIAMTREYIAGHYFKRLTLLEAYLGSADYHIKRYIDLSPDETL